MRKSTRRELNKSRELLRFLLRDRCCCFCKEPLIDDEDRIMDGEGRAKPIAILPTIHHHDPKHLGKKHTHAHRNQQKFEKRLAHPTCHRRYTATLSRWGNNIPKK